MILVFLGVGLPGVQEGEVGNLFASPSLMFYLWLRLILVLVSLASIFFLLLCYFARACCTGRAPYTFGTDIT